MQLPYIDSEIKSATKSINTTFWTFSLLVMEVYKEFPKRGVAIN